MLKKKKKKKGGNERTISSKTLASCLHFKSSLGMTNPRRTPYKIDGKDSRMSRHKKVKKQVVVPHLNFFHP